MTAKAVLPYFKIYSPNIVTQKTQKVKKNRKFTEIPKTVQKVDVASMLIFDAFYTILLAFCEIMCYTDFVKGLSDLERIFYYAEN